jgi:NADH-quinone oxidoreductase subunit L
MTRCVYLTFFGTYRGHGHPHESPKLITVPLVILAGLSVVAGLPQAFGIHAFGTWTKNEVFAQAAIREFKFSFPLALGSLAIALGGIGVGAWYWAEERSLRGLAARNRLALAGDTFLLEKYYLDHIYEDGVVAAIKGPIANGVYWFNQNILDGIVNRVAIYARRLAGWVYNGFDQAVLDGTINGFGAAAEGGGAVLRTTQTGRVQQYAALMFGAAAIIGLALVLAVWS